MNGNCRAGDQCKFSHDISGGSMPPSQAPHPGPPPQSHNNSFQERGARNNFGNRPNQGGRPPHDRNQGGYRNDHSPGGPRYPPEQPPFNNQQGGYQNQGHRDNFAHPNNFRGPNPYEGNQNNPRNQPRDSNQGGYQPRNPDQQSRGPRGGNPEPQFVTRFEGMKPLWENDHIFQNNLICRDVNWPDLIFKSVAQVGQCLLILIDNRNFFLQFDLQKRSFLEKQKYLPADINDSLTQMVTGPFGDIPGGPFTAFAYYKVNEVMLNFQ